MIDDLEAVDIVRVIFQLELLQRAREHYVGEVVRLENTEGRVVEHHSGGRPRGLFEPRQVVTNEFQVALLYNARLLTLRPGRGLHSLYYHWEHFSGFVIGTQGLAGLEVAGLGLHRLSHTGLLVGAEDANELSGGLAAVTGFAALSPVVQKSPVGVSGKDLQFGRNICIDGQSIWADHGIVS